ncbi:MAG: serine/threonine protein kinase [Polyangiaceae bacterium]|nr:serine/threonine protein kinase [Polyangiaceae bacterium]
MSGAAAKVQERASKRLGSLLAGKYHLERLLGVGGMAAVYAATHRNGRSFAVKLLHPELAIHEDIRARFVREGYVANTVDHPGAVPVFDDGEADEGIPFLVMELLAGETLAARAERFLGKLPPEEVLAMGHQMLDVLGAAHRRGIIHRDIKPENLFLTTTGIVKCLDFGVARIMDDSSGQMTATGARIGTPAFMPPEQALGRSNEIGPQTDVWAVGATLFSLIAGRTVHTAENAAELIVIAATTPPLSILEYAPDLPKPIAEVIDKAVSFKKADRFPDASAMQEALEVAHLAAFQTPLNSAAVGPLPKSPSSFPVLPPEAREAPTLQAENSSSDKGRPVALRTTLPMRPSGSGENPTQPSGLPTTPDTHESEPPLPRGSSNHPAAARAGVSRSVLAFSALGVVALFVSVLAYFQWKKQNVYASGVPAPSASSGELTAGGGVCTRNADCLSSSPTICRKRDGQCVSLALPHCRILASPADISNDATVWVGAMFPTDGVEPTRFGPLSVNVIDLARRDLMDMAGGLPPTKVGGPKRPVGVVACDDLNHADASVEHLVSTLEVSTIIGFARSDEVLSFSTSHFNPRGVFTLAANTAAMLRDIPTGPNGKRLVWRVTISPTMTAPVFAELLSTYVEPEIRKKYKLSPSETLRLALTRTVGPTGQSYADLVMSSLRYNGRSVIENGTAFRQFEAPDTFGDDSPSDLPIARALAEYAPHIILFAASAGLPDAIEHSWLKSTRHRPFYVGPSAYTAPSLRALAQRDADFRTRYFTVDTPSGSGIAPKVVHHYNASNSPPMSLTDAVVAPYDAFYLFVYAATALGDKPLTGANLSEMLPRLQSGESHVEVGPSALFSTLQSLVAGKSVKLKGAQTNLDFNPTTGEPSADFAIYCLSSKADPTGSPAAFAGLLYVASAQKLEGAFRCPD